MARLRPSASGSPAAPPLAPAAPLGDSASPHVVGPPHPSAHHAVGSRSLLTGGPVLAIDVDDAKDEEDEEDEVAQRAEDAARRERLAALARSRGHTLPPPITSSVLPPALPPLPLPLSVLQQRKGRAGDLAPSLPALPRSPSLPPPLPMGRQCFPEQQNTCSCKGGSCECDLYPDYSPRHPAPSAPTRQESDWDDEVERAVVPPVRRLQFFNSNFKSKAPSPPAKRSRRGRAMKEQRTGPSLRVLCYCRCPSRDSQPFG